MQWIQIVLISKKKHWIQLVLIPEGHNAGA